MRKAKQTATKALWATGASLAGALGLAMLDGALSWAEVIASGGTALIAGAGTYYAPANRDRTSERGRPEVYPS